MSETQGGLFLRQVRQLVAAHGTARLSDCQLLEQYLARRDESAFAALVQRHGQGVLRLCRSLLNHLQDAEDVFQATFLVLARKAGSIRKREALGSWLYGVAHRLACKARARVARRTGKELAAADEPVAPAADDMTWRELRVVLHEELSRLPDKYRAPLLLCYWEGKTQEEAAAQLGWRKGTLKERVQRARELLRARLTGRGMTLSAALVTALLCERAGTAGEALTLVNSTTRAALAFAAGKQAAAGGLTAAVALAEGVVRAMFLTKLKIAAAVLLTLGLLGAGFTSWEAASAAAQDGKPKAGKPKTDQDRIQGTWVALSGEKGGEPSPKELLDSLKVEFTGNKLIVHVQGGTKEGTFTLRPNRKPKEIDLVDDSKTTPGIYFLQGDELKICIDDKKLARPTEFKTQGGGELLLLVLRREKAKAGAGAAKDNPKDETDPAKLRLRIQELERALRETQVQLDRAQTQLQQFKVEAEQRQREALRQRAAAEDARQRADRDQQRALEAAEEARRAAERLQAGGADRQRVRNDLKQLALAMYGYFDNHKHFPPAAIYGKDGKPLLSWRVAILPWLERAEFYKQFKLDEAWDSPHNKKLLTRMPRVFAPVAVKAGRSPARTQYRVFTGPGTVFQGQKGSRIQDITDGTSNTVMIVEAGEAVPWTKPDELPYDPAKALPKLGGQFKDGFFLAMCDGSVHFVRTPVNERVLRSLITRDGGEVVDANDLGQEKKKPR